MSQPSFIESHYDVADALLPAQFSEKPIFHGFLKTWMDKLQEVEDIFYDGLFIKHLYRNASGDVLDKFGSLFGLTRSLGETDSELRRRIVGEVMKRASDGTPDRIREIIESLINIKETHIIEHFPSCIFIFGHTEDEYYTFNGDEAEYIKDAAPVGTGSCVLGFVEGSNKDSLFIPSEASVQLKNAVAHAPQIIGGDPKTTPLIDWNIVTPDGGSGFDNIVVRDYDSVQVSVKGAILPEIGYRQERFQVDTQAGDIEDFSVDSPNGRIGGFYVDNEGVENDKGIMLEIVQRTIPFDNVDPIGTYP